MVASTAVDTSETQTLHRLREEHRQIEVRLEELGRHIGLTSTEKVEYAELKKRKLVAKDRIRQLQHV
jgi:hypothetical protein